MRLILASASPARLAVLRAAGVEPIVRVSGVDEDAVAAALPADADDATVVEALARAKALSIAEAIGSDPDLPSTAVVIGCDSMLAIGGALVSKPVDAAAAHAQWRSMSGNSGRLLTGHAVVVVVDAAVTAEAVDHSSTVVHFGSPTARELDAYIASGEPLAVAGSFTLDGRSGWFIDGIDGDPSSVIGIGLPLVRRLLAAVGVDIAALWAANPTGD
ncbi:Maf family protein [Millisia brevis]|uniref:Maf family protein n=1 Tax=Millisia brevis TaxID=264148 RepID=UPI00082D4384|nr:Maf family protein [Millisia brevis]